MKYSLLSRFQGCFEGMAIADQVGLWMQQTNQPTALHFATNQGEVPPSPWVDLAFQVSEALIQANGWSFQVSSAAGNSLLAGEASGRLAIATLPIALFYHDDLVLQQQQLRQTVQLWGGTPAMEDWVTIFGYAIAQALKEQLTPEQFFSHLLRHFNTLDPDWQHRSPKVLMALQMLESLLESGAASAIVSLKINQILPQDAKTIVLALYCFLSTPDHWRLSVLHAAALLPAHPELCTLTGSLAGAYNSHSSLPLEWKVALQRFAASQPFSPSSPGTSADLAARLLASWSGMFEPVPNLATQLLPVTSPQI